MNCVNFSKQHLHCLEKKQKIHANKKQNKKGVFQAHPL